MVGAHVLRMRPPSTSCTKRSASHMPSFLTSTCKQAYSGSSFEHVPPAVADYRNAHECSSAHTKEKLTCNSDWLISLSELGVVEQNTRISQHESGPL